MANILEIILKTIRQGQGVSDTQKELTNLEKTTYDVQSALGMLGVAFSAQQGIQIAKDLSDAARAANDAKGALIASTEGAVSYEEAIAAAREATRGMVSEQQLASSLTTIFGSKLADNAQEAAALAAAGTTLVGVFESAGASMDLFTRYLNSGSRELSNNFGISEQLIASIQRQIEASGQAAGNEARILAVRQAVVETAKQYQTALTDDSIAAAQFEAALNDAKAALGQFVLPEVTDAMQNFGTALRGVTDALNNMSPSARGAVDALIDMTNPLSALNGLIEDYQVLTGQAAATTDQTAAAHQNVTQSAQGAVSAIRLANDAMSDTPATAAASAQAINSLASSYDNMTNRERDAMEAMALARGKTPELLASFNRDEASRKSAEEEQAQSKQSARTMTTAFSKAADDIGNIISGKLQTTFQEVFKLPEGSTEHADEPARRLATVAAAGFSSEWLAQLNQQFAGQSFWAPMAAAMQSGNQAELQAAATTALQQFSQGLIPQLWNVEQIRNQIRAEMQAKRIKEQLTEEIKQQLGAEGISQSIGVVEMAAGNVTAAQATVQASTDTMSTSATAAGTNIKAAFDAALPSVDVLNSRLRIMAGLIERVDALAKGASGSIAGMNPPAAGSVPNDAQTKMGGDAPL